jgi:hypothetical protein
MMTLLQDKLISSYADDQLDDIVLEDGSSGTTRTTTSGNHALCLLTAIIQVCSPLACMTEILYDSIIVSAVACYSSPK